MNSISNIWEKRTNIIEFICDTTLQINGVDVDFTANFSVKKNLFQKIIGVGYFSKNNSIQSKSV